MSAPTTPDLRPLAIGELIDRSAQLWRSHFGALFRLYLGYGLSIFILQQLFRLAMKQWFPLVGGGPALIKALDQQPFEALRQYGLAAGPILIFLVLAFWGSWMVVVAGSHFAIRHRLGQSATLSEGFSRVRARLGALTGAFVLSSLAWMLAMLLFSVPGLAFAGVAGFAFRDNPTLQGPVVALGMVVMLLGMLAAVLWYLLRFLFTGPVIAMEDVGAWAALRRSGELISGRIGKGILNRVKVRATLVLTIVFAILMVVGMVAGIPATILQFVYANPLDPVNADPNNIPQLLMIPAELLSIAAQAVFSPLYLVVAALFYVDMRVRREGLDLELQLEKEPRTP